VVLAAPDDGAPDFAFTMHDACAAFYARRGAGSVRRKLMALLGRGHLAQQQLGAMTSVQALVAPGAGDACRRVHA
jgi:hypothetical protein